MDSRKIDAEQEAKILSEEYWNIWERIGYEKNRGNNRSIFGNIFEEIIMKFILSKIKDKKDLKIGKGLIKNGNKLSPQVDIIIYSGQGLYECPLTRTAIVRSENVKLVLEIKSYLDKTKLHDIKRQIQKIKESCPSTVTSCIFIGQLFMNVNEQEIKNRFDFCNNFVVLYRKSPRKDKYVYDYGEGLLDFLNILNNLK